MKETQQTLPKRATKGGKNESEGKPAEVAKPKATTKASIHSNDTKDIVEREPSRWDCQRNAAREGLSKALQGDGYGKAEKQLRKAIHWIMNEETKEAMEIIKSMREEAQLIEMPSDCR